MVSSPSLAPGFLSVRNVIKHGGTQNTTGRRASPLLEASLVSSSLSHCNTHRPSCICQTIHPFFFFFYLCLSLISMQEVGIFHSMPGRQDQTGSFWAAPKPKHIPWSSFIHGSSWFSSGPWKSFKLFCLPSEVEQCVVSCWERDFWIRFDKLSRTGWQMNEVLKDSVKHWINASRTLQPRSSWDVDDRPGNQTWLKPPVRPFPFALNEKQIQINELLTDQSVGNKNQFFLDLKQTFYWSLLFLRCGTNPSNLSCVYKSF